MEAIRHCIRAVKSVREDPGRGGHEIIIRCIFSMKGRCTLQDVYIQNYLKELENERNLLDL